MTGDAHDSALGGTQDAFLVDSERGWQQPGLRDVRRWAGVDAGNAIALDNSGNIYLTGRTASGDPATSGAYDETLGGSQDAFVAKFSALPDRILSLETVDFDRDGQIDYIKMTADGNLNDDFSDLAMTVAGYTIDTTTPFLTQIGDGGGASDDVFYVKLVESGTANTMRRRSVSITANSMLTAGGSQVGTGGLAATDKAGPAIIAKESSWTWTATGSLARYMSRFLRPSPMPPSRPTTGT